MNNVFILLLLNSSLTWIVIILTIALLVSIYFNIDKYLDEKSEDNRDTELSQYTLEVETIYNKMRGIRHDYRNNLQVMQAFLQAGELASLEKYLDELVNEMNQVDTIIRTGNVLIDSLVNTKMSIAKNNGVNVDATALAPKDLTIDATDVATILGNLLNNAIEATTNSKNQDKFIRVYIAPMKDMLYINVTNSMDKSPKINFKSLKAPNRMGFGLHRIDATVKKYNGFLNRQWEEGVFSTEITLPL